MELFKMAKEAMSMRSKVKEMEKALKAKIVDIDYKGIKISMNAKNEIVSLKLPEGFEKMIRLFLTALFSYSWRGGSQGNSFVKRSAARTTVVIRRTRAGI